MHLDRFYRACGPESRPPTAAEWTTPPPRLPLAVGADRTPEIDPGADDQAALEVSRRRILAEADLVVPGHGEPFRTGRTPG